MNLTKDIFFHLSQFLSFSELATLGRVNKHYKRLFEHFTPQFYYQKVGNFNYAWWHAPKRVAAHMMEEYPFLTDDVDQWREIFYKKESPKVMMRTVIQSNNIDLITMYRIHISQNPEMAAKLIYAYSDPKKAMRIAEATGIGEYYKNFLLVFIRNRSANDKLPYHFLIRHGFCNDYLRYFNECNFSQAVLNKSLYYCAKMSRPDIFIKILIKTVDLMPAVTKLLRKKYYRYVEIIINLSYISSVIADRIRLYGDPKLINLLPQN